MEENVYIAVHPGYGFESDEYMELGLRNEDYFRHNYEFFSEFRRAIDSESEVVIMSEKESSYSEHYLGDLSEEVDHFFDTVRGKGKLTYEDADEFIDFILDIDKEASVTVSGELNNLCHGQAMQIVEYVLDKKGIDADVRRGVAFPERPLERDEENDLKFAEKDE